MVKVLEELYPVMCQHNRTAGMYMNELLKHNLDKCKQSVKKDWDVFFIVDGSEGCGKCLSEDTVLKSVTDFPAQRKKFLKDYKEGEWIDTLSWDFDKSQLVTSKSTIKYSGKKELFELRLETNKKVKASSLHRFFVLVGNCIVEKRVEDLKEGDYIMINSAERYLVKDSRKEKGEIKKGIRKTRDDKRLKFIQQNKKKCESCGIAPNYWQRDLQIHHRNGCRYDNDDCNLQVLCCSCHFKIHRSINRIYFEKIKNIESIGIQDCYDLETPTHHNFILDNGIVSHNSVFAQQVGKYLDPTMEIDQVVFTSEEFIQSVQKSRKYQCIIYDEAYGGLASRRAMTAVNHALVKMMAEVRQKNLFVILVLPSFFELDRYAAIHRSRTLFHVYHNKMTRGYFKIYSKSKKKRLYLLGKKNYNYRAAKVSTQGRFTNFYTVDEALYKKKKKDSLFNSEEIEKKDKVPKASRLFLQIYEQFKKVGIPLTQVAKDAGIPYNDLKDTARQVRGNLVQPIPVPSRGFMDKDSLE